MIPSPDARKRVRAAVVCLAAILAAQGDPALAAEDRTLQPGTPVEGEIRGGETHSFLIDATAGHFLQAVVEQKGIDLTATLFAPDGRQLFESDLPNGSWGPETIAVVLGPAGTYKLNVWMQNSGANPGKYEARIVALRDPSVGDREMASAEAAVETARKLRQKRTAAAREEAIRHSEAALRFFEKSGDRYRQGLSLNSIGLRHAEAGDLRTALGFYGRAIEKFREIGELRSEASSLANAGGAYDVLGDPGKAREYYERVLAWSRTAGESLLQAITLNNIGKLYHDQSEWQKAIEYYRQALPLFRAAGDRRREGVDLRNLGSAYTTLGDHETARDHLRMALELSRSSDDKIGQANSLNGIGISYRLEGRVPEALPYFEQTLEIYRAAGDRRNEAWSLNYIGACHGTLGDTGKALEAFERSIGLSRAIGDRRMEGIVLGNIASTYARSGKPSQAIEYGAQSLSILRAIGDRNTVSITLHAMAQAQRELGDLAAARRYAEEALATIEQVRGGAGELRASYLAGKQDAYGFLIDLLMEMHGRDPLAGFAAMALAASERSRARSMLEMLAESGAEIREGVDPALLGRERDLLNRLNAKGSRLLPLLGRKDARVEALQREVRELEREYEELQTAIRRNNPAYAELTLPRPLTLERIQTEVLDGDTMLLEYRLGAARSFLWVVGKNSLSSFELPARDKIERKVEEVSVLLTARSAVQRLETPAQTRQRIARADAALPAAARELSEMVLGPAAGMLGNQPLVVIPDGALQRLPFALLPVGDKREPLIVSHELVTLPSASALAVQRQQMLGRKPASKLVAVFGDPVFDRTDPRAKNEGIGPERQTTADVSRILEHLAGPADNSATTARIPRLPYTAQEADRILQAAGTGPSLKATGFQANRAAATSRQLGDYRYIHFATHGYLNTEQPGLSALVLSQIDEQGRPRDGFLRVNDVYNARLSADLVVLSACQTGLGKEVRGEGLMGLTRAFLYAGAPRVIVSLWNVNDQATAQLMAGLYRRMLREGKRPSTALREAQNELRNQKRWQSPYYWAAFVQQGEWR